MSSVILPPAAESVCQSRGWVSVQERGHVEADGHGDIGWDRQAVELASETACAEGASLSRHDRSRRLVVTAPPDAHPTERGGRGVPSHRLRPWMG